MIQVHSVINIYQYYKLYVNQELSLFLTYVWIIVIKSLEWEQWLKEFRQENWYQISSKDKKFNKTDTNRYIFQEHIINDWAWNTYVVNSDAYHKYYEDMYMHPSACLNDCNQLQPIFKSN